MRIWKSTDKPIPDLAYGLPVQSLDEATLMLQEGAYTTFRTYNTDKAFHLRRHFDRLEESARLSKIRVRIRRKFLRLAIQWMIKEEGYVESRIRIVLDFSACGRVVYIFSEPLTVPKAEDYLNGVRAITIQHHRNNPKAKLTDFIDYASHKKAGLPDGVNEALMVDDGIILEGLSSNYFAVVNQEIRTAGEGVLHGITREMVIRGIEKLGLKVSYQPVRENELGIIDECFITSTSRGVLPLTMINDFLVGNGKPGKITQKINDVYEELLNQHVRKI